MLFNSYEFFVFFAAVYLLYLALTHRWQNRLLLLASLAFYGWWDFRFLALILFSIVLDYVCGLKIGTSDSLRGRRAWLYLSLAGNLGMLGFFKYFHFFVDSFIELVAHFGFQAHRPALDIILPIGISFYTFQTLSYTLDIYRRRMEPTRDFLNFSLFVSFFPQLLAGPIERARNLLPQIERPRIVTPDLIREGAYLFAWGLFKKVMLADNMAPLVNRIFSNSAEAGTLDVMMGLYGFLFQIYCDFSGYSDMARGLGKMMGFHIMLNFRFPLFAERPAEFWARWHISLTTWVRDYVFVSLGADRRSPVRTGLNLLIVMTLIGLWHGAAWTFVAWGFYFGVWQAAHMLWVRVHPRRAAVSRLRRRLRRVVNILLCSHAVVFSVILFRSENWVQVMEMTHGLFRGFSVGTEFRDMAGLFLLLWLPLSLYEFWQFRRNDQLLILRQASWVRFAVYVAIAFWGYMIFMFSASMPVGEEFIYFQF